MSELKNINKKAGSSKVEKRNNIVSYIITNFILHFGFLLVIVLTLVSCALKGTTHRSKKNYDF